MNTFNQKCHERFLNQIVDFLGFYSQFFFLFIEKFEKKLRMTSNNNSFLKKNNNLRKTLEDNRSNKLDNLAQSYLWSFSDEIRSTGGLELFKTFLLSKKLETRNYYQNSSILNIDENITKSSQESEEKATFLYKAIMKMIENHLNDKEYPLKPLLEFYLNYFIGKAESEKNLKENLNEESIQVLLEDLKTFLKIMRNSVYIFYNFPELCSKIKNTFYIMINFFTLDNLTNFFTSYFFYKFEIYDIIFDLICKIDDKNEQLLQTNFEILKNWTPSDFGVSEPFTLDNQTYKFLKKKNKFIMIHFSNINEEDDENEEIKENYKENNRKNENSSFMQQFVFPPTKTDKNFFEFDKTEKKLSDDNKKDCIPYKKAIEKLKIFGNLKSPLHQLKILNETFENIIDSISEFYSKCNVIFDKLIESDDLISIFLYVISQSQLPHLLSHIKIIENFITQNYMFNLIGYQFVTLKVCLNYIENIREIQNRKNQKSSVSLLRESILCDIRKETESYQEKKTIFI